MFSEYYSDGTVTVANGSASVTGTGTAWSLFGVAGGVLFVGDKAFPIASVESDTALTLRRPATATFTGVVYDIGLLPSEQASNLRIATLYSEILARNVGFAFGAEAEGSLAGRVAFDAEEEGFRYAVVDDPENPVFYRKASDILADWSGPFPWRGPAGVGVPGAPGASDVVGTSTSSVAIGTGAKTFTIVQADRGWGVGARLRISSAANVENFMEGEITSYSGATLQVAVDLTSGAGTHADWIINVAGVSGQTILFGTTPPNAGQGSDGDFFIDRVLFDIYGPKTVGAWGSPTPIVTAAFLMNLDGGNAASTYGGTTPIDGGDATAS